MEYSHPYFYKRYWCNSSTLDIPVEMRGGRTFAPLFVVVKTRYLDVPSKDCKIYFKKIDKLYDGMVFSRGFSPKQSQ